MLNSVSRRIVDRRTNHWRYIFIYCLSLSVLQKWIWYVAHFCNNVATVLLWNIYI